MKYKKEIYELEEAGEEGGIDEEAFWEDVAMWLFSEERKSKHYKNRYKKGGHKRTQK